VALEPELWRTSSFRNDDTELRRLSHWFRQFAAERGVPEAQALDFELCLNELATNIIHYAYDDVGAREIRVTLERTTDGLRATIEDDGRPFDPLQAAIPSPPSSLESARIGGWGIPIVRALADEVAYERRDGWNRVTILSRIEERTEPRS
jgi:serine/threonine-protein kinase RsbW